MRLGLDTGHPWAVRLCFRAAEGHRVFTRLLLAKFAVTPFMTSHVPVREPQEGSTSGCRDGRRHLPSPTSVVPPAQEAPKRNVAGTATVPRGSRSLGDCSDSAFPPSPPPDIAAAGKKLRIQRVWSAHPPGLVCRSTGAQKHSALNADNAMGRAGWHRGGTSCSGGGLAASGSSSPT